MVNIIISLRQRRIVKFLLVISVVIKDVIESDFRDVEGGLDRIQQVGKKCQDLEY